MSDIITNNDASNKNDTLFKTEQSSEFVTAPLGKRFVAGLLDCIFVGIGSNIISSVTQSFFTDIALMMTVSIGIGFILTLIYWVFLTIQFGATPGKKIFNLQIIDIESKELPSVGKLIIRELPGRMIGGLLLAIGYIMIFLTDKNQALHDKFANTVVVEKN